MLTVTTHDPEVFEILNFTYHVFDSLTGVRTRIHMVEKVTADGDELHEVYGQLSNLPQSEGSVVTWYGDHAKFIVENLDLNNPRYGKYDK